MPLDPSVKAVLDILDAAGHKQLHELPMPVARAAYDQLAGFGGEPATVGRTQHTCADGVPVRLYWPDSPSPHPVLLFVHGGGWVLGSLDGYDGVARDLSVHADCLVVSVGYRLAPDNRFPAAVEDVVTVAKWVMRTVESFDGDIGRLAVAGDSAGGNLSAVLVNELPGRFRAQALLYPVTDQTRQHPSVRENGEGYMLTEGTLRWFSENYLGDQDPRNPLASPLYAADEVLAAAPPTLVVTGEFDPLRDEGEAYVARLRALGVRVEHRRYDGMIHAFFSMRGMVPAAGEALRQVTDFLRDAWV
ncbi:alpha/beta hydrolase [Streptantibioticus ferralitis]|uniref:Alpha/beta hydrolase n=1 Tax=Streptantibioticus ferralitis TaxID=236510 RepID=A0ABT5Z963_9ACTN|nr:alpha/beta hydrolase [Streptantibioticus ferralitis]MDF2260101.1 alpha/beta hydrolase [Streptantibioticus ferralitis]